MEKWYTVHNPRSATPSNTIGFLKHMTHNQPEYEAWLRAFVNEALPIELQEKIVRGGRLTRDEALALAQVLEEVAKARAGKLSPLVSRDSFIHSEIEKLRLGQSSILAEIKRQGLLTRREFRKIGEDKERNDKRTVGERTCIDKAVHLYILHKDVNGDVDASLLKCCNRYWKQASEHFDDIEQYRNAASYDYRTFYDITAIADMIKGGEITF